jgi:DNA polymerase-3 subunit gamma/tau
LADGDAAGVIAAVADIDTHFPDYARLLEDLARLLQRIAIHQVIGAADYEDEFDSELLAELAASLPAADVQLYYQTALIGRRDLYLAPDPRGGAEMTLLRMLAFRPALANDAAPAPAAGSGSRQGPQKPLKADTRPGTVSAGPAMEQRVQTWQDPDWNALINQLELKGAVRMLAINCAFLRRVGDTLYFTADAKAEPVLTRPRQQALAAAVSAYYGETLAVQIGLADGPPAPERETPVQQESRESDERYAAARRALESDPNIKALKSMFGAELKSDTIEPLSPRQSD